ncbi:hypothetical protein R5R35_002265 [Gryllus longicercus]|uniref:J domain-containing protein n=1 Tax=Gryllus longicercus TaxID=2509291 RepID=A0AAN9ZAC3_9ORTH
MNATTCIDEPSCDNGNADVLENNDFNRGISLMKQGIGNVLYQEKSYSMALLFYTEAIGLCPDSASYITKAKCHMQMHEYKKALEDARKSLALDPDSLQGHLLVATCALALGERDLADEFVHLLEAFEPTDDAESVQMKKVDEVYTLLREAESTFAKGQYFTTLRHLDRILERLPARKLKLHRAECLVMLEQFDRAYQEASDVLLLDKSEDDALYVLGLCSYYEGFLDLAVKRLRRVLKASPAHKKAKDILGKALAIKEKIEDGSRAIEFGLYRKSHRLFSEALEIDPSNRMNKMHLLLKRSRLSFKLGKLSDAVEDCSSALAMNAAAVEALLLRGKLYVALNNFPKAVADYETLCRVSDCYEYKLLLKHARRAMKQQQQQQQQPPPQKRKKSHYSVLGVAADASADEIRAAFRRKSLLHHPDRHVSAPPEAVKLQEALFKEVAQAYAVLSDARKRADYDDGRRAG